MDLIVGDQPLNVRMATVWKRRSAMLETIAIVVILVRVIQGRRV
jgi:hypothetical protein